MAIPGLISSSEVVFNSDPSGTQLSAVLKGNEASLYNTTSGSFSQYPAMTSGPLTGPFLYPVIDQGTGEIRPGTLQQPPMPSMDKNTGEIISVNEALLNKVVEDQKTFVESNAGGFVPFNPANYDKGTLVISSNDYPAFCPGPVLEAIIGGKRAVFVGTKACEDAKNLVIAEGKGEFYGDFQGDSIFYMLAPSTYFIGSYNCVPCDPGCCIEKCYIPPGARIPYRRHREYYRVYAFTTFIYDRPDIGVYESINSNVVVTRTVGLPVAFDVQYLPPGVTHIRYWSKNEVCFCTPDDTPPCPYYCGQEHKVGGDDDFFLRDVVEVPREKRPKMYVEEFK